MHSPHFNVFQYDTSADLLRDYIEFRKQKNRHFSISSWAKKLALPTSGIIVNFIKKRRLPSEALMGKIAETMDLSKDEAEYLTTLVALERARHAESMAATNLGTRIEALRYKQRRVLLSKENVDPLLNLGAIAVKVLLEACPHLSTPEQLQQALRLDLTEPQIQSILEILAKRGVIALDENGHFKTLIRSIDTEAEFPSEQVKRFHQESLTHAMTALHEIPVNQRHFRSYVLSIPQSQIPAAKEAVAAFVDEFVARFEPHAPTPGDPIMQLNVNLVPLSTPHRGEASS